MTKMWKAMPPLLEPSLAFGLVQHAGLVEVLGRLPIVPRRPPAVVASHLPALVPPSPGSLGTPGILVVQLLQDVAVFALVGASAGARPQRAWCHVA